MTNETYKDYTRATITGFDYTREPIQAEGEKIHCLLERSTMDETMGSFSFLKSEGEKIPFREGDKVKIHLVRMIILARDLHGGILGGDYVQLGRKSFEFDGKGEIINFWNDVKYKGKDLCTIRIRWAKADESRGG